jgi:hypothetical protein
MTIPLMDRNIAIVQDISKGSATFAFRKTHMFKSVFIAGYPEIKDNERAAVVEVKLSVCDTTLAPATKTINLEYDSWLGTINLNHEHLDNILRKSQACQISSITMLN